MTEMLGVADRRLSLEHSQKPPLARHDWSPPMASFKSSGICIGWNALTLARPVLPIGILSVSSPSGASASRTI